MKAEKESKKDLEIKIDTFMFVYRLIVNTFVSVIDWHQHIVAYVEYKNTQSTPTHTGVHTVYLLMLTAAMKLAARISMCERGFFNNR